MSVFIIIIDKSRSRSILQLHNQPLSSGYGVKIRNFETMTLMLLLFWNLSFYQISSFSYYFDWRPSLGVKERHPQTWPNPTHGPNGPRCDRGQGWNLRAARVTHCGPIRYQRRTEGKLFHDIYVETSLAPLVVILFLFFQEYRICVFLSLFPLTIMCEGGKKEVKRSSVVEELFCSAAILVTPGNWDDFRT